MKMFRKGAAALMVMMLLMMMSITAAAETTYSITITNREEGYTYKAYQIFVGDLYNGILSNVTWGSGINDNGQQALGDPAALAKRMDQAGAAVADQFADSLVDQGYLKETAAIPLSYANGVYTATGLAAGYYLVVNSGAPEGTDTVYSDYIVQVVNNVTVTPKAALPTVDKQVYDADAAVWMENADYAINVPIQFKLIATLTADPNYTSYATYKIVFEDTLSEGLTFDQIDSVKVGAKVLAATDYTTTGAAGVQEWTLTINNLLTHGTPATNDVLVEVTYTAHLNEHADTTLATGTTKNENKVALQYSNDPNGTTMGTTESDSVFVFTYGGNYTKVDGKENPLPGAGFTIYKVEALADGGTSMTPVSLALTEGIYYPTPSGVSGVEHALSQEDGLLKIHGLDAGEYLLKETLTPDGFNTCADIPVTIEAVHDETTQAEDNVILTTSNTNATIINQSGAELPHTGGRGTMIFYVTGMILMVASFVTLIIREVRRRMYNEF